MDRCRICGTKADLSDAANCLKEQSDQKLDSLFGVISQNYGNLCAKCRLLLGRHNNQHEVKDEMVVGDNPILADINWNALTLDKTENSPTASELCNGMQENGEIKKEHKSPKLCVKDNNKRPRKNLVHRQAKQTKTAVKRIKKEMEFKCKSYGDVFKTTQKRQQHMKKCAGRQSKNNNLLKAKISNGIGTDKPKLVQHKQHKVSKRKSQVIQSKQNPSKTVQNKAFTASSAREVLTCYFSCSLCPVLSKSHIQMNRHLTKEHSGTNGTVELVKEDCHSLVEVFKDPYKVYVHNNVIGSKEECHLMCEVKNVHKLNSIHRN